MEYITGALVMAALFVCMYGAYRVGYKAGKEAYKPVHKEVDEQTVDKAKQIRRDFQDLMSYDVAKATGKKVI
jgi:formiminotetrahydrofolate cyclodeaminase